MALVVFLRGVNVGGHRTFRPSLLAQELKQYDVVNVGAAGTFVVRRPGASSRFRTELLAKAAVRGGGGHLRWPRSAPDRNGESIRSQSVPPK